MALEDQVELIAHGLAHGLDLGDVIGDLGVIHAGAALGLAETDVAGDHEAGGVKAHLLDLEAPIGHGLGGELKTGLVGAHLVAALAAQQLINRHAQGLALDIPEGDVDGGQSAHEDGAAKVHAAVEIIPVVLNAEGILADEIALHLFQHAHAAVQIAPGADFAGAVDAGIGVDLDKEILAGR